MWVKWQYIYLLFAGMAVTICQESVDGSRKAAELLGKVFTSKNGDAKSPFFMVFQIASGFDNLVVRFNNSILDRRAENCSAPAPSLCSHQLWLPPEVCKSTANLTFFPSHSQLAVSFSYTGIEFCKYFAASHLQCSCDHCGLSELDSTSPGNDRVEPWTLQLSGVFIFILAITVIVLTITVIVLAILLCMECQRNKGTDQKKGDESLKYPSLNLASHNVTNFDDGEQHSDGETEDNVSTSDAKVSEVASDKQNDRMAIDKVDISQRGMAGQNMSRALEVRVDMEPPNQSETGSPEPESCEPPKEIPGAGPTDDQ